LEGTVFFVDFVFTTGCAFIIVMKLARQRDNNSFFIT
jgi:hypothetical protein